MTFLDSKAILFKIFEQFTAGDMHWIMSWHWARQEENIYSLAGCGVERMEWSSINVVWQEQTYKMCSLLFLCWKVRVSLTTQSFKFKQNFENKHRCLTLFKHKYLHRLNQGKLPIKSLSVKRTHNTALIDG